MIIKVNFFWNIITKGSLYFSTPGAFLDPPALVLVPGPGPQFLFIGPGPQFVFTDPGTQFVFTGAGLQFYCLCGSEFAYSNLVSSICICIYSPGLRFVLSRPGPEFAFTLW